MSDLSNDSVDAGFSPHDASAAGRKRAPAREYSGTCAPDRAVSAAPRAVAAGDSLQLPIDAFSTEHNARWNALLTAAYSCRLRDRAIGNLRMDAAMYALMGRQFLDPEDVPFVQSTLDDARDAWVRDLTREGVEPNPGPPADNGDDAFAHERYPVHDDFEEKVPEGQRVALRDELDFHPVADAVRMARQRQPVVRFEDLRGRAGRGRGRAIAGLDGHAQRPRNGRRRNDRGGGGGGGGGPDDGGDGSGPDSSDDDDEDDNNPRRPALASRDPDRTVCLPGSLDGARVDEAKRIGKIDFQFAGTGPIAGDSDLVLVACSVLDQYACESIHHLGGREVSVDASIDFDYIPDVTVLYGAREYPLDDRLQGITWRHPGTNNGGFQVVGRELSFMPNAAHEVRRNLAEYLEAPGQETNLYARTWLAYRRDHPNAEEHQFQDAWARYNHGGVYVVWRDTDTREFAPVGFEIKHRFPGVRMVKLDPRGERVASFEDRIARARRSLESELAIKVIGREPEAALQLMSAAFRTWSWANPEFGAHMTPQWKDIIVKVYRNNLAITNAAFCPTDDDESIRDFASVADEVSHNMANATRVPSNSEKAILSMSQHVKAEIGGVTGAIDPFLSTMKEAARSLGDVMQVFGAKGKVTKLRLDLEARARRVPFVVRSYCAKAIELKPMRDGAQMTRIKDDEGCLEKISAFSYIDIPTPRGCQYHLSHSCSINEECAVRNRVLCNVAPIVRGAAARWKRTAYHYLGKGKIPDVPLATVVAKYAAGKANVFLSALLKQRPEVDVLRAPLKTHVKLDEIMLRAVDDPPTPRAIQADPVERNVEISGFCTSLANYMKLAFHCGEKPGHDLFYSSGATQEQIAQWINRQVVEDRVPFCYDISKMDGSVSDELYEARLDVFETLGIDLESARWYRRAVRKGLNGVGRWFKYSGAHGQPSGRNDTSVGQTLTAMMAYATCLRDMGIVPRIMGTGDDSVISVSRSEAKLLESMPTRMRDFGLTITGGRRNWDNLDYCSASSVATSHGYMITPLISRLPKAFMQTIQNNPRMDEKKYWAHCAGVAQGMWASCSHAPLQRALLLGVLKRAQSITSMVMRDDKFRNMLGSGFDVDAESESHAKARYALSESEYKKVLDRLESCEWSQADFDRFAIGDGLVGEGDGLYDLEEAVCAGVSSYMVDGCDQEMAEELYKRADPMNAFRLAYVESVQYNDDAEEAAARRAAHAHLTMLPLDEAVALHRSINAYGKGMPLMVKLATRKGKAKRGPISKAMKAVGTFVKNAGEVASEMGLVQERTKRKPTAPKGRANSNQGTRPRGGAVNISVQNTSNFTLRHSERIATISSTAGFSVRTYAADPVSFIAPFLASYAADYNNYTIKKWSIRYVPFASLYTMATQGQYYLAYVPDPSDASPESAVAMSQLKGVIAFSADKRVATSVTNLVGPAGGMYYTAHTNNTSNDSPRWTSPGLFFFGSEAASAPAQTGTLYFDYEIVFSNVTEVAGTGSFAQLRTYAATAASPLGTASSRVQFGGLVKSSTATSVTLQRSAAYGFQISLASRASSAFATSPFVTFSVPSGAPPVSFNTGAENPYGVFANNNGAVDSYAAGSTTACGPAAANFFVNGGYTFIVRNLRGAAENITITISNYNPGAAPALLELVVLPLPAGYNGQYALGAQPDPLQTISGIVKTAYEEFSVKPTHLKALTDFVQTFTSSIDRLPDMDEVKQFLDDEKACAPAAAMPGGSDEKDDDDASTCDAFFELCDQWGANGYVDHRASSALRIAWLALDVAHREKIMARAGSVDSSHAAGQLLAIMECLQG